VSAIPVFRKMFAHMEWADVRTLDAVRAASAPPGRSVELFAHILGADLNWLARIQGATPRSPIWSSPSVDDCTALMADTHAAWRAYVATLTDAELARRVHYKNSAGLEFDSTVEDILLQVCLHAMNHRGQVNAHLRAAGFEPNGSDYIAFARGVPAATRTDR
jgi:uncharacterized damage-inducible protein DinB